MPYFHAADGTQLAYHVHGDGRPLVCLPGGPMRDSAYFGDLPGQLAAYGRQVIRVDLRGTGQSAVPADPASYRCDRLVADVDALRKHLGAAEVDLLGHSGGASLAVLYASEHPDRVASLLLITPSTRAVGIGVSADWSREVSERRKREPWYDQASAALARISAGQPSDADWDDIAPFVYGRWDAAAREHCAAEPTQVNGDAADVYNGSGAFDPAAIRAALARFSAPVLVLAGELDLFMSPAAAAEFAGLFRNARLMIQLGAGHFPWLDDAPRFAAEVNSFLASGPGQERSAVDRRS